MNFTDDYQTVIDFGRHKGKKLIDVSEFYLDRIMHIKNKPEITNAIKRIMKRIDVPNLVRKKKTPMYIPDIKEISGKIKPLVRDPELDPFLFKSFAEYLIESHFGLPVDQETQELLAIYAFGNRKILTREPSLFDQRIELIRVSSVKKDKSIIDICNLSFSYVILMGQYDETKAENLLSWVKENEDYLIGYLKSLTGYDSQNTYEEISVGCVTGIIDMVSDKTMIEMIFTQEDDAEYYRRLLFGYASLHYLINGKMIDRCEVRNFITGKCYVMDLDDSCEKYAREYIKGLGSYCKQHLKLFNE